MRREETIDPTRIPAELTQREFEISVRKLADDLAYGEDNSVYTGSGVDYAQSRPFVTGDSVRDIDWRVTARTDRFHVKEYEATKRMPVHLVVDTSGSMHASSRGATKHQLAVVIAGSLALAAIRRLSPVGVADAGERSARFPPSLSRARIFHWMHELRRPEPGARTQLGPRLDEAGQVLKSRTLVIALSDFHDPEGVFALKRLAQRHDAIALHLEDPAERGRLRAGFFRAREAETGRGFVAHGRSRWFGPGRDLAGELGRAGIDYLRLPTDQPFIGPLRRFLRERGVLGRNAR